MQELIDRIVSKTGIPQDKAQQVLQTVAGYVKEKYPALGGTIDSALGITATDKPAQADDSGGTGGMLGGVGGMFGS